jgi:hypothetical protein
LQQMVDIGMQGVAHSVEHLGHRRVYLGTKLFNRS